MIGISYVHTCMWLTVSFYFFQRKQWEEIPKSILYQKHWSCHNITCNFIQHLRQLLWSTTDIMIFGVEVETGRSHSLACLQHMTISHTLAYKQWLGDSESFFITYDWYYRLMNHWAELFSAGHWFLQITNRLSRLHLCWLTTSIAML